MLGTEEHTPSSAGMFLPELDTIMGAYESDESMVMNDSHHTHIEPPTLEMAAPEPSQAEATTSVADNALLKILSLKLGVDLEELTEKEQAHFVSNLADMALTATEQVRQSQHALEKIQTQLAVSTASAKRSYNLFTTASNSKEIFSHLKNATSSVAQEMSEMFQDIDKHNIAFYTAFKNLSLKTAETFSPEKLQYTFEKKNLLNKNFSNKKALAWEAYCAHFKHLDEMHEDDIDLTELQKEYNAVLETLNFGYAK